MIEEFIIGGEDKANDIEGEQKEEEAQEEDKTILDLMKEMMMEMKGMKEEMTREEIRKDWSQ